MARKPIEYTVLLVDDPAPHARRITLNRPEKRNALNHTLRGEIVAALQEADQDPEVCGSILRAAGPCLSAGRANEAYPAEELEAKVLEKAKRIAAMPPELVQLNKRVVHRQMESPTTSATSVGLPACSQGITESRSGITPNPPRRRRAVAPVNVTVDDLQTAALLRGELGPPARG